MYKGRWQAVPPALHISYHRGPLTAAFQPEQEKPPCELRVQCECARDDHAAALEVKHSQTRSKCDKAPSCDSDELTV